MFGIENPYLSTIVNVVTVLGGLTTALGAMLYVNQNKLLYMPNPPGIPKTPDENPVGWKTPREWNSHGHQKMHKSDSEDVIVEDTMIETFDGVKIHTWLIMHRNAERFPTLVRKISVYQLRLYKFSYRYISTEMLEIWVLGDCYELLTIVPLF